MANKLKRWSVSIPDDIKPTLELDAQNNRRPVANHILEIIYQYYAMKKLKAEKTQKEASELFATRPLREAKVKPDVPVYEMPPDRQGTEPVSKVRGSVGR